MSVPAMHEAMIPFRGRRVRVVLHGMGGHRTPLLCVPGGPAMSHHYIASLAALATAGRPVVFYDPLGSGGSDRPSHAIWDLDVLVEELDAVCTALALPRFHLFAHSVASFAALPYAARRPRELAGLVLASAPASMPAYQASVRRLLDLDARQLADLERADRIGARRDAAYARVYERFVSAHMCRIRPSPPLLTESIRQMNLDALRALKGGTLLYTTALAEWDGTAYLPAIAARTLVTCGRHDIFTPADAAAVQRAMTSAELAIFDDSSHMPHVEESERYAARVDAFLDACDAAGAA